MRAAYFILFKLVDPKSIKYLFYYFSKFYFGVGAYCWSSMCVYIQITIILFLNINKIRNVFSTQSVSKVFDRSMGYLTHHTLEKS